MVSRTTKLFFTGTAVCGICGFFATRARGSSLPPSGSLIQPQLEKGGFWVRTFKVYVPISKIAKLGPEFAQPIQGSNGYTINTTALFNRYMNSALQTDAFKQRCERLATLKKSIAKDNSPTDPAAISTFEIPNHASSNLSLVATKDGETLLHEKGTSVYLWLGLRELKPQWVGDTHQVEYEYATILDTNACSPLDYIVYFVDLWQCRRVLNEASRASSVHQHKIAFSKSVQSTSSS